jgi:hypothetical protein
MRVENPGLRIETWGTQIPGCFELGGKSVKIEAS